MSDWRFWLAAGAIIAWGMWLAYGSPCWWWAGRPITEVPYRCVEELRK